jgi:hypothetical protein
MQRASETRADSATEERGASACFASGLHGSGTLDRSSGGSCTIVAPTGAPGEAVPGEAVPGALALDAFAAGGVFEPGGAGRAPWDCAVVRGGGAGSANAGASGAREANQTIETSVRMGDSW